MTANAHLKERVRARMAKTGERYAAARRQVVRQVDHPQTTLPPQPHRPGSIPATTALAILLAHRGVTAPHTDQPFSEAMLFGLAGGIGLGIFSFFYEKEDHATFFLAGRHQWHDDLAYLNDLIERLSLASIVREATGAQTATRQLVDLVAEHGPCIAWVDMATLPHRAMPASWSGGGYHVIMIYQIDPAANSAVIGDLTDLPITVPLDELTRARGRIVKQRYRLLALPAAARSTRMRQPALVDLVRAGLQACHTHLLQPTVPSPANARLTALQTWAERLDSTKARESWERVFRPGANLWRGLQSIHTFIEHYGTGGGLCRPVFAEFLTEASTALNHPPLLDLAGRYTALGEAWSALADAALPDDLPLLAETKRLLVQRAELYHSGGPTSEISAVWQRLGELEDQASQEFPLSEADCRALRMALKERVLALFEGETAAHAAIPAALP